MNTLNFSDVYLNKNLFIRIALCVFIATTLAFLSHVFIHGMTQPLLTAMTHNIQPSNPAYYPREIIIASYFTAFFSISAAILVYYYAGHALKIKIHNKVLRSLVLGLIILAIKGELIRYTIVGYLVLSRLGAHHPLFYIFVNQADIWFPNIILAFCLVYLCPLKTIRC